MTRFSDEFSEAWHGIFVGLGLCLIFPPLGILFFVYGLFTLLWTTGKLIFSSPVVPYVNEPSKSEELFIPEEWTQTLPS